MANEVTTQKDQLPVDPDMLNDLYDDAGEGASYDASDMLIPFVRIAQQLTPHINKKKPEYIEGLSAGDAYNTVTKEWWPGDGGFDVVVVYQAHKLLEFVPRAQGGGFRGERSPSDPEVLSSRRDGAQELLPNGNELVRADQHFVLILGEDGMFAPAVVDMKSTQLKVSRRWKTQIAMQKMRHPTSGKVFTPPLYGTRWHLRTVEEHNDKGDFYNWQVDKVGPVTDRDLFAAAKALRISIEKGEVRAVPEDQVDGHSAGGRTDDDIPF